MKRHTLLIALVISVGASSATRQRSWAASRVKPVKVFILAGQSNMVGHAQMSLLKYQVTAPKTKALFAHLYKNGQWVKRDDVWIRFLKLKGRLSVGYGGDRGGSVGPELEFGNTVGNYYDEPVLLIKTAWGGKSLFRDFRSPSAGLPSAEYLQTELKRRQKRRPNTTMQDVRAGYGRFYREMLREVRETLENVKDYLPAYKGQGCEIAGFVWFQGFNDMINPTYTAAYTENMVHFIEDVRKDLKRPALPFVIGQLGVGGDRNVRKKTQIFKDAQAAAAKQPRFKGNVALVRTDQYWDWEADAVFKRGWRKHLEEWKKVGSNYPYHYLGSHKCYGRIGKAFAQAIIKLNERKQ